MKRSLRQLKGERDEVARRLSLLDRDIAEKELLEQSYPAVDAVVGKYYRDTKYGTVTNVTGVCRRGDTPMPSTCRYVIRTSDDSDDRAMLDTKGIYDFQTVSVPVAELIQGEEITKDDWERITARIRQIAEDWVKAKTELLVKDRAVQRERCREAIDPLKY